MKIVTRNCFLKLTDNAKHSKVQKNSKNKPCSFFSVHILAG